MRRSLWVLLWLFGILFPVAFLARLWPSFGYLFDTIFAPGWVHVVMHVMLFAFLAILLCNWLKANNIRSMMVVIGLALFIGVLQETIQLTSQRTWPGWGPELLDLGVDMLGACLGILLYILLRRRQHTKSGNTETRNGPGPGLQE